MVCCDDHHLRCAREHFYTHAHDATDDDARIRQFRIENKIVMRRLKTNVNIYINRNDRDVDKKKLLYYANVEYVSASLFIEYY